MPATDHGPHPDTPRRRFGRLVRDLRTRRGLTQADIGRIAHTTADAVATWERGRSLPDEPTMRRVAARLDPASDTLLTAWRAAKTDSRTVGPPVGPDPATVLAHATQDCAEFGTWAERLDTGEVAITTLMTRARDLATQALTAPPAQILAPASDLNRELFALLRGHHTPAQARDLYTVAGAVCALMSFLASDLGALSAAQVHAATAQACAEHADRDEVRAWVASAKSKNAFWEGDYLTSARLAAGGPARQACGTAAVMLACQEADAYAKLGAHDRAESALDRAAREADRDGGPDLVGGVLSCPPVRHGGYVATAHTLAKRHSMGAAAAEGALAVAAQPGPVVAFGSIAQLHITRAMALKGGGDLDGAASALRPVLDLPPGKRLATITGRLRTLAADLDAAATRSSRVAAPLREEIAEYCAGATQKALPAGGREP